ncbi:uncharacterized protein [Epargyreus clarus]|uniref:uncharacterized protein isoform X4 n=1 Tax=Epargyreus clarus TaxID=520877 RepID=UPI003C2F425B
MSGKPATLGASRAGVAGAPRVLVYVAEPRQLESAGAGSDSSPAAAPPFDGLYVHENLPHHLSLPRTALYRPQPEHNDQRNAPSTLYYKQYDSDGKVCYGVPDNVVQRAEFYPVSQQFMKESCIKVEDCKVLDGSSNLGMKKDCILATELNSIETFHTRVSIETGEPGAYQAQCPVSSENNMPSMVTGILHPDQNLVDSVVQSGDSDSTGCSDKEQPVGKSYVNYQILEQSVQHQSIVNQSINILNQQVGVSRSVVSEGDGGSPQLVRTADGVVLAVVPSPVLSHSTETELRTAQSEFPQTITVPLGWRRIVNGTSVLYVSPSGTALSTLPQLRDYLQTAGTCKCGLPCPLRPETAFSFDPKVVSKPYQVASGAELTKLCNHKRKLLASLQARAQSPATPPPQIEQKKTASMEVGKKKKVKKRTGYLSNMSVSQLMVQRERPLHSQSHELEVKRTASPGTLAQRAGNMQPGLPGYPALQQNMHTSVITQETEIKQETQIQRSSHYLTVNSGWITHHQEHLEAVQKQNQTPTGHLHPSLNVGMPVLGTNGQIIGVNTSYNMQAKNLMGVTPQSLMEHEHKDDKRDIQAATQSMKTLKDDAAFCGINQALTPEVMQKINEQQQLFIQQNQKQIDVMKGFKTQLTDTVNLNKSQVQNQFVQQGQLMIQNGSVVKANSAKTPPWQVKRNDSNTLTSPSPKPQKQDNTDYEDTRISVEEASAVFNSYPNNDPSMCSRVPPLPQHYNIMGQQWPAIEQNKKKTKSHSKSSKKKASPTENKVMLYGNNGIKYMQDPKNKNSDEVLCNNVPSFMEDPSGYLAQQTALLNNTISRQVGINSSYEGHQYESSSSSYCVQNQNEKQLKNINKTSEAVNVYRSNVVPNSSPSPNNTPDSSLIPDKSMESASRCCKGCNVSYKGHCSDFSHNQNRTKYMKQGVYGLELDGNPSTSSPKHGFDDNPVTSSTYIERNIMMNDNCGPIQAGIVSTSNVSPTETLQPPEPSPTLSNSSRNTDTPHSSGSNNSQMQNNCTFPMPSPAYSNPGSCRDSLNSNPSTPNSSQPYPYNSPGPPTSQAMPGTQMLHFISNHNLNKNLIEVENISIVGMKPGSQNLQDMFRLESKKRMENAMPGYCPPPHMGGGPAHSLIQACYVQTFVTTMASGFSVTRDTVTSVLAGKANTATTSINASQANFIRPPPPPSINLATTYAIPNNQPDPFINSVNLPTSYPLHIAGTTAQSMISKSPLEMVQNVISSMSLKPETSNTQSTVLSQMGRRSSPGQIVISSTGQILVSSNQMPPPPPKNTTTMSVLGSNAVTNVTTSVTQVVPAATHIQPLVNQPTVVVNTLPAPFVLQQSMIPVDGQVMQQNQVIPQLVTGGIVSGQAGSETTRQIEVKNGQNFVQGVAMLSPESLKKRSKKKKNQAANITNVLQITAPQQNPNNIMVHHSSPQHNSSPQFSPRGFQLSPTNNISPTPMLQALTIMPGKSGTPAHIVMNGQGNSSNFGSQQIIANTSPSQQINLLQPVNLINNANNVMSNFPAFQQFIVPNLSGMVMTADGTAIIQDNSTGMPMQLQIQTVNGQNVLTPVQNSGVFTAGGNSGVVIRAQNQQGKIIQSPHSPGAQFLSPNSQVMMNSPNFNGQLSPLLANLSPTNVTFNTSPHQVRPGNVQAQEFIQTNQMGQTLMVPLSPKQASMASANNNRNSTFVQQNTTIVQQQTTLVSNSHNAQLPAMAANLQGNSRLGGESNVILAQKMATQKGRSFVQEAGPADGKERRVFGRAGSESETKEEYGKFAGVTGAADGRHSVSTQTRKSPGAAGSPPDTTTHSPLGALDAEPRCLSTQGNYADTTTESPEPDNSSSAMVQCVSSSEQDMAESRERAWPPPRNETDTETQSLISNMQLMRSNRIHNTVESTEIQYNQSMASSAVNNQHNVMPMTSNYYERSQGFKRKNDFGDSSTYRADKIMRTNYNMVHGAPKDTEYDNMSISSQEKQHLRHYPPSGTSSNTPTTHKVFDRHNSMASGDASS